MASDSSMARGEPVEALRHARPTLRGVAGRSSAHGGRDVHRGSGPRRPAAALRKTLVGVLTVSSLCLGDVRGESWPELQLDARRSGDARERELPRDLVLLGAVELTDAAFSSPVIDGGRVFVLDGSGVLTCADARSLRVLWRFASPRAEGKAALASPAGTTNTSNVSTPVVAGGRVSFGTMAGDWIVLDVEDGRLLRRLELGEPVFSAAVTTGHGIVVATLGARVVGLTPEGDVRWEWDFVREVIGFQGDRWSGVDWARRHGRATWREQFLCARDIAADGDLIVLPAGGTVLWLRDRGDRAEPVASYRGSRESPTTLALSVGEDGAVYRQWHRRDNNGSVEVLRLGADGKPTVARLPDTETSYQGDGLIGYSAVATRGPQVYRTSPQEGRGLRRHREGAAAVELSAHASIAPPVLTRRHVVYGGLDGRVHVAPIDGRTPVRSLPSAFGRAFTAPLAVSDGRIFAGCEDGYLYVWGEGEAAAPPKRDLELWRIRSPLSSPLPGAEHDWFTNFGNFANTNTTRQPIRPPFRIAWIRRFQGTVKHFSVCGEGRLFTHTAEGQIFAVEQETGRLLWRRWFPGVHVSFTAPLYHEGKVLVPQAGLGGGFLRAFDAASGRLLWEVPFSGSPSWNRQLPPIVHEGRVFYCFSSGSFPPETWLFEHQSTFGFPDDHRPLVRAWDLETGRELWTADFSRHGAGGDDAGMCLLDGTLYYSCYFGDKSPSGVTAAIDPASGETRWVTTEHSVHAGCTVSGSAGRIYLGGYNPVAKDVNRVWCLDARTGKLLWGSEPLTRAIHVVTVGDRFLFTHSQYKHSYLLEPDTGAIRSTLLKGYNCTRFTLCEPYLLGANMDVWDTSGAEAALVSSGPAVDVLQCVGAFVSNGRVYYTTNGGGIQLSMLAGSEAERAAEE